MRLRVLAQRDGTLIADWGCNVLPPPQESFKITTHTFHFRALLTKGGAERLELARA